MKKIMIVTNSQGMLIMSLKNKLQEHDYETLLVQGDIRKITLVQEEIEAVLLYADEELAEDQQIHIYLRDRCLEDDIPMFLIGDRDQLDTIGKTIAKNASIKEYVRPINVNEAAEDMLAYLKEHGKEGKKKILVVDDSGAMLRNVKGWLEDKYQVILANSGAMAIKYLSLNRPDLVLLDYEMPIVDGRQVLEMIRSEIEFADIPVIFLTSKNDKESVANVVKLRPDGYLLKTMKPEEIVKFVDDFFVRQKGKRV